LTGYLYDGDCVVAEFDAWGKVQAQYIHGPGLGADVGSLICAQTLGADGAASERYYSHNWRGDTIGITDESGASLARYRYGAFGELIAGDGGIANNILLSGKRYDSAAGLYYFGARYYDASSGRFVSRDPMGYIDGPNEYILAMNNPLLWIDPYGLWKRQAWNSVTNLTEQTVGAIPLGIYDFFTEEGKYYPQSSANIKITDTGARPIYTNGIQTSYEEAQRTADKLGADLFYNPPRGFFADGIQTIMQKTIGRYFPGSLERSYANTLNDIKITFDSPVQLISHSQGTVTTTGALEVLRKDGIYLKPGSSAVFLAPATLETRINYASGNAGISPQILPNKNDFVSETQSTFNMKRQMNGWSHLSNVIEEHDVNKYIDEAIERGYIQQ